VTSGGVIVIVLSRGLHKLESMNHQEILDLLASQGQLAYEGEGVTQLQHGWQAARLAELAGATPALQLATWLHDIGHLLTGLKGSPTLRGIDDAHEFLGARLLTLVFGSDVGEPVGLHVQAKRAMVGTQPNYLDKLSADSLRSLKLQGGPMSADEAAAFVRLPYARDAMRVRAWDDCAKEPALVYESSAWALNQLALLMNRVQGLREAGG
jgi:predicted HD phosphohydrolase